MTDETRAVLVRELDEASDRFHAASTTEQIMTAGIVLRRRRKALSKYDAEHDKARAALREYDAGKGGKYG